MCDGAVRDAGVDHRQGHGLVPEQRAMASRLMPRLMAWVAKVWRSYLS